MKKFFFLILIFFSFALLAAPECDYHFSLSNATIQVEDNSQTVAQNISIYRGQNSPDGRCKIYRVFFSKGLANNYQRKAFSLWWGVVNYNLHSNINQAGILKEFGDAQNNNEFIEGSAPDKFTTYNKPFYISVPGQAGSAASSGTYFDIVQVTIYGYNENSGNYLYEDSDTFTVFFTIPKKVQLSLVDEGGTFDSSSTSKVMDFGILAQNQEKGADLRVISNGSYQIKVSSQNNGKLKLSGNESIGYSLRVNGSTVGLGSSSANPVQIGSGNSTGSSGDLYNLKVKITESTNGKSAGLYQDVIVITAIAN